MLKIIKANKLWGALLVFFLIFVATISLVTAKTVLFSNSSTTFDLSGSSQVLVPAPIVNSSAATRSYVDSAAGGGVSPGISGQTLRNNGSTWVASSVLFNNGTNVGVGTTNPTYKLQVVGAVSGSSLCMGASCYSSWPAGPAGDPGTAATVNVGTTATGAAGTSASVVNSGTTSAAIFDFTIPKGDTGQTGSPGTSATVNVGVTATGAAGTSASVVNSGTTSAAIFDFTIPKGDKGDPGVGLTGGTINYIPKWDGTNSVTTSQIYDNGTNIGIGTAGPTQQLDVNGSALLRGATLYLMDTNHGIRSTSGQGVTIFTYGVPSGIFLEQSTGRVGIGSSSPASKLYVAGDITATGSVTAQDFIYSSDRSLKKNIRNLTGSLAKIEKLQGVSFNWKSDSKAEVGLIAQDVQKVYPELVHGQPGHMGVKYGNLVAPLIEAVKEQQQEINSLKIRIKALESK